MMERSKNRGIIKNNRGQLTVFIIVGVLIAVSLVIVFFLYRSPNVSIDPKKDPQGFVENCVGQLLDKSQEKILVQAGYRNVDKYIVYKEQKVPYLCYTSQDRQLCTIIEPMLKNKIQDELKLDTQAGLDSCFDKLRDSFSSYGYQQGPTDYSVEINSGILKGKVNKKITITRGETVQEFNEFEYSAASPLFDFIVLTNDILTKETTCDCERETCSLDVLSLSRMNTRYELGLFITSSNEKVYSISDTLSNKKYMFSVRNCIRLP